MVKKLSFYALTAFMSTYASASILAARGGQVEILAVGRPSFIHIQGKGSAPKGQVSIESGKVEGAFEFDLTSLDTGISMRNEHMKRKYLEVQKYPKANLNLKSVEPLAGWKVESPQVSSAKFVGTLTIHGVTKPVTGTFTMNDKRDVDAKFTVKLSDFQIEIPSFAGVTVKDEVEIKVTMDRMEQI